jgi:MoxR-like ATPase
MLADYHTMVRLSRQMLEAARCSDWELLVELGAQRDAVEARLRAAEAGAEVDPAQAAIDSEQEKQMVEALIAANQQIKLLVDAHLASLQLPADAG